MKIFYHSLLFLGSIVLAISDTATSTDSVSALFSSLGLVREKTELVYEGDTPHLKYNTLLLLDDQQEEDIKISVLPASVISFPIATYKIVTARQDFLDKHFQGNTFVCLKKGTPIDLITYYYEAGQPDSTSSDDFISWYHDQCLQVDIGFVNFHSTDLQVYWLNRPASEKTDVKVFQGVLKPGEPNTFWRTSYIGHRFLVTNLSDNNLSTSTNNEKPINITYLVEYDSIHVIGSQKTQKGLRSNLSKSELSAIHTMELNRADRIKRVFTNTGYKRVEIPKRLWGSIRTFWHNNRDPSHMFEEIWNGRSVYVNWWDVVPTMAVVPFGLKMTWHDMFQPVLEEWANTKLEATDLYGIRVYYEGNWLVDHVDRHETHAVSAIINVEQGNLGEDWELEIYDVYGNIIHSDLQQGEAMLYESAKCMHGRPKPVVGDGRKGDGMYDMAYYANVFFHYKPVVDEGVKWWEVEIDGRIDSEKVKKLKEIVSEKERNGSLDFKDEL